LSFFVLIEAMICRILAIIFLIFTNDLFAFSFDISHSIHETRSQYGSNNSLSGVETLERTEQSIRVSENWSQYSFSLYYNQNAYSEAQDQKESGIGLKFGMTFDLSKSLLSIFIVGSKRELYLPVYTTATNLEKVSFIGKGGGVRLKKDFIGYEYYYESYGDLTVASQSTTGKEFTHKIFLEFGSSFNYGVFYFNRTQDFTGTISSYKNSQGIGFNLGFSL
jgi:hypothetical protein